MLCVVGLFTVTLALSGCGKHESPPPPAPAAKEPAASVESTPAPAPEAPAPTAEAPTTLPAADAPPEGGPDLERLNRALELFVYSHKRFPRDIAELCREEEMYAPPVPAGKKLVIDQKAKKVLLK